MELVNSQVEEYLRQLYLRGRDNAVLDEMEREAAEKKFPIIGPLVGRACYLHALSMGARSIFELGSGYGYSTYWFAQALRENGGGIVHHCVWDEALSAKARDYLSRERLDDLVEFHVSEAVAALRATSGPFDIVFMDIDKHGYPGALPYIKEKLRPGGLLIIDNILWHGAIFDEKDQERNTAAIREVTRLLFDDSEFVTTINPLRDGFIVAWRRGRPMPTDQNNLVYAEEALPSEAALPRLEPLPGDDTR